MKYLFKQQLKISSVLENINCTANPSDCLITTRVLSVAVPLSLLFFLTPHSHFLQKFQKQEFILFFEKYLFTHNQIILQIIIFLMRKNIPLLSGIGKDAQTYIYNDSLKFKVNYASIKLKIDELVSVLWRHKHKFQKSMTTLIKKRVLNTYIQLIKNIIQIYEPKEISFKNQFKLINQQSSGQSNNYFFKVKSQQKIANQFFYLIFQSNYPFNQLFVEYILIFEIYSTIHDVNFKTQIQKEYFMQSKQFPIKQILKNQLAFQATTANIIFIIHIIIYVEILCIFDYVCITIFYQNHSDIQSNYSFLLSFKCPYIIQIYILKHIQTQFTENMQQNRYNQYHPQPTNSNLIMISRTNLLSIQQQVSCKICLQKGGEMISPCLCKGSLQFVHENCIKQWLKHQLQNKNQLDNIRGSSYQKCEICKQQIRFNYVEIKYCGCHTFVQRIKIKNANLCSYMLALFVLLIALAGFLSLLIKSIMESNLPSIAIVIIVILQTLFLVGFLLIVVNCIFEYFVSREILISRVLNKNMVNGY